MAIKTGYICPHCTKHHLKDYTISGDYDEDGVLLSFCPKCGRMYTIKFSQSTRKIIAIRLAMRCNLDFSETKKVVSEAPKERFIDYIVEDLRILKKDILAVLEKKYK